MSKSGFHITKRETDEGEIVGFKMFFENGYGVSVIFGGVSNSDDIKITQFSGSTDYFCENAEVAVLNPTGNLVPFGKNDKIKEKVLPEQLPQIISWVMNR